MARTDVLSSRKSLGAHYTPPELAGFVAELLVGALDADGAVDVVRALDPACGTGELLLALADADKSRTWILVGVDRSAGAIDIARSRLSGRGLKHHLIEADFLDLVGTSSRPRPACDEASSEAIGKPGVVIANPPYVRTQVLGAAYSKELTRRFDLTGRVDLMHAFVAALPSVIAPGGLLGLICSNRFLSTRAGAAMRQSVTYHFDVIDLFDLGDTKIFDAAVLPAVLIARRREPASTARSRSRFTRIYESRTGATESTVEHASVFSALSHRDPATVRVGNRAMCIEVGQLSTGRPDQPWRIETEATRRFLEDVVSSSSGKTLGHLGKIRVGIKTTADSVFIRDDWERLPDDQIPEAELLKPLITRRSIGRWVSRATSFRVLYTHTLVAGRRVPIALDSYPRAARYLHLHFDKLNGREYVLRAGRNWYEIWVPQQPSAWTKSKLVFPDISDDPCFALDQSGNVVNGDCYWMALDDRMDAVDVSVALAVCNSSLASVFYDIQSGNRLYAGRRRFMTQYVQGFPMPCAPPTLKRAIHDTVNDLQTVDRASSDVVSLERTVDDLVWQCFRVSEETRRKVYLQLGVPLKPPELTKLGKKIHSGRQYDA